MNTLHALFPVKILAILKQYERSRSGQECIKLVSHVKGLQLPEDNFTRTLMSSPPLFDVINKEDVRRIRLAYMPDNMLKVYEIQLELYAITGELLEVVKLPNWSMALSLAIEAELLERILNINPL